MNKKQLLELEANSHLTPAELRKTDKKIAEFVTERIEAQVAAQSFASLLRGSEKLKEVSEKAVLKLGSAPERTKLRGAALMAMREAVAADAKLAKDTEVGEYLAKAEASAKEEVRTTTRSERTLAEAARLDEPIAFNPAFTAELAAAKIYRLGDAAGIADKSARLVIDRIGSLSKVSENRLAELVKKGDLEEAEAKSVGRASALYEILDQRVELVEVVSKDISDTSELVKYSREDWEGLVTKTKVDTPGDIPTDEYAELLHRKIAELFPAETLAMRHATANIDGALKANAALDELRKDNPEAPIANTASLDNLDLSELSKAQREKTIKFHAESREFVNRFAGLRLGELLDDTSLSAAARKDEAGRRTKLSQAFLANNPDLLSFDLTSGSDDIKGVKFPDGTSSEDKQMLLAHARTYQRTYAVTDDIEDAAVLVDGGYLSAVSVASSDAETVADRTGLSIVKTHKYFDSAKDIAIGVTGNFGSVLDVVGGIRDKLPGGNTGLAVDGFLKEIPGFADFFGNQDFCDCAHCQSILSPAAYFVDLMGFIEEHITEEYFVDKPDHPLNLKTRRPDLWTTELTCENTNQPIPYLVIINEILENAVATESGYTGGFGDRIAVGDWVYKDTLPEAVDSFHQPLHLPWSQIRVYLGYFGLSVADLAETSGVAGEDLGRLRLGLSVKHHELIATSQATMAFLKKVYGIAFTESGGKITKFETKELLGPMGIEREDLDDLITTRFITDEGALNIRIRRSKRSSDSIQNDVEHIENLTRDALDRMHRFVRLQKVLGWKTGELDMVLVHLAANGIGSGLDPVALGVIGAMQRLAKPLKLSVEELVATWSDMPQMAVMREVPLPPGAGFPKPPSPLKRFTISLFDRQFNPDRFVDDGGPLPQNGTRFLHPALASSPPATPDTNLERLMFATGTSETELLDLIRALGPAIGSQPDSVNEADRSVALTLRNLTLLYRHARLAKVMRLSITELFALISLSGNALGVVDTIDDLEHLFDAMAWLDDADRDLAELVTAVIPAIPAIQTSASAASSTTAGQTLTLVTADGAGNTHTETVTFTANATLDAMVSEFNSQAQHVVAYAANDAGLPAEGGTFFAVRSAARTDATLEITADPGSLFGSVTPPIGNARPVASALVETPTPSAEETAEIVVSQAAASGMLAFADTVFTLLDPFAPYRASVAAFTGAAGGEKIDLEVTIDGAVQTAETVTLAATADLEAGIDDWNAKSATTIAYRADVTGQPNPAGSRMAITTRSGSGSTTTITITRDTAGLFTGAVPTTFAGGEITAAQSQAIIAANLSRLDAAGEDARYLLKADFDPATALTLPSGIDPALEEDLRDLLLTHHAKAVLLTLLPDALGVETATLSAMADMLEIDLSASGLFTELRDAEGAHPLMQAAIARLQRLATTLGAATELGAEELAFINQNAAAFGISDFDAIDLAAIRNLDLYAELAEDSQADIDGTRPLHALIEAYTSSGGFASADQDVLGELLGGNPALAIALDTALPLAPVALAALAQLRSAAALALMTGAPGDIFTGITSASYDDLAKASAALQSGLRAQFETDEEWEEAVEPLENSLLSIKRDGLVSFLIHSSAPQFDEVNDLYHYYLLDVQVEGCMRTSRVAAAIDSAQLYVNRCTMNLEETPRGAADPLHVLPESVPDDEWSWRRNYRVWEASRKIFLYPENYIEPELRDDKTPLFRAFEEELLANEVTDETALDAFGRYLRGFDEVAHLTIAGSYHEKDDDERRDTLHLLGVTADDPPTYFYRRVEDAAFGANASDRATHWSSWEQLDVQIPVRKASPVVHRGQLYLFWVRYVTKSQNEVDDGQSRFVGYQHKAFVEFTKRKLDGSWTTPQKLRLNNNPFTPESFPQSYQDDGVILDPIVPKELNIQEILWFDLKLYSNFEPLYDNITHEVPKEDYSPRGFQWDQVFPASNGDLSVRGVNLQMWSPVDLYRLEIGAQYNEISPAGDEGVPWLNPAAFIFVWLLTGGKFELTSLLPPKLIWSEASGSRRDLHSVNSSLPCFDTYTYATLLLDRERVEHFEEPLAAINPDGTSGPGPWTEPEWDPVITDYLRSVQEDNPIGSIPASADLNVVNGSVGDVVIQTSRDSFYLQGDVREDGKYHLRRLNSSLSEEIADILFHDGLESLLATESQLGLQEESHGLNLNAGDVFDATHTGDVDYSGPMGAYLREIYFHIPFLVADHLNSLGKFEEARRWYHFIFDPTSADAIDVPAGLSEEEAARRRLDRSWRYREFRSLPFDTMREQLTNGVAIEQYRRDPFNPHAIARLRLSAYQKAVVLKYIDNELDCGDDLFVKAFAQSNPEYLRDATLKYVLAQELLGGRPAQLGDCGTLAPNPRTYGRIAGRLSEDSEFLMEFESVIITGAGPIVGGKGNAGLIPVGKGKIGKASSKVFRHMAVKASAVAAREPVSVVLTATVAAAATASVETRRKVANFSKADIAVLAARAPKPARKTTVAKIGVDFTKATKVKPHRWGRAIIRQVNPVFCVPRNDRIDSYWNRVEDRLYKLRHCQDIDGNFRLLPLFAPSIDPALLVAGAASGLSLGDILASSEGAVPPYRFRYLLDKARGYAATVQSFGSALLGALEKRDGEELARLRDVHQRNLLNLSSEVKDNELKIAAESVEIVRRRMTGAEYRRDYYDGLISQGLLGTEVAQQVAQHTSSIIRGGAMAVGIAAAITRLIPQIGSPFAMKYGGMEVGDSLAYWLQIATNAATISDSVGKSMGILAANERRQKGWEHQLKLVEHDIAVIEKDLEIAELRRDIAERAVHMHEVTREQLDEVMEFADTRFTNLALYSHLARSLQQLHREAYNNALALARMAEQAYRFERPGETAFFVGGEWDSSRAGLHAGERLSMALAEMDRRFIETNTRKAEINQTFSLSQIAPDALIALKESGSCEFALPEFYFDIFYPGQYRRRIKAVRLTIPCITGPYTNIGAKLTLQRSYVRKEPQLGLDQLLEVPFSGTPSIATSTAQGDAGVFELNFRDEKYMPFEGAGAISDWRLDLPSTFRPFDYDSINDVLVNISYTAEEDGGLRQEVEDVNGALDGSLVSYLTNNPAARIISLRQEFSTAFNQLLEAPTNTPVTIEIGERHFPLFLQGRQLNLANATIVLDTGQRDPVGSFVMQLNGQSISNFPAPVDPLSAAASLGGLPSKSATAGFASGLFGTHTLEITDAGDLDPPASSTATLDNAKLNDILIIIEYTL